MATPTGIITIWNALSGAIPSGWVVCDGANDTPDLRGLFIYGASTDGEVGTTGGASTHVHTMPNLSTGGSHRHTASGTVSTSTTTSSNSTSGAYAVLSPHTHTFSINTSYDDSHSHSGNGDSSSSSSIPPCVKLYYIMKT